MGKDQEAAYLSESKKQSNKNTTVAIIGAGFLGRSIAIELSLLGVSVLLYDTNQQNLNTFQAAAYEALQPLFRLGYVPQSLIRLGSLNVTCVNDIQQLRNANIVIEAIPEDLCLKTQLFAKLEDVCPPSTIFTTNTIALPIDSIQNTLQHPNRLLGMRFFHPVILIPSVEITLGKATSQQVLDQLIHFLLAIDKLPHRGPTRRVLSKSDVNDFQLLTSVRSKLYHGLLDPTKVTMPRVKGVDGPPLVPAEMLEKHVLFA